jgi:hypothetical protein
MMLAEAPVAMDNLNVLDQQPQQTTLYDLIATMYDVASDSEDLITATVIDMLRSRRIRFLGDSAHLSAMIAATESV